jgi:hypothetical protein
MACNLAMSFLLWHKNSPIKFFLVTDRADYIPEKIKSAISVLEVSPAEVNEGFSSKLQIRQFAQTDKTLFIDADCLVYGDLEAVFDQFAGKSLSVVGYKKYEGKDVGFCRDIKKILSKTGITYFPLLCGSIYYIEKNTVSAEAFDYTHTLLKSYDELGLVRLREKENEEPLMAIAMAKYGQEPIDDTGLIKADRMFYEKLRSNVLKGRARLWNEKEPPIPDYSTLMSARPLIVHFNAAFAETFEYDSEVSRLRNIILRNWPAFFADYHARLFITTPGRTVKTLKSIFRPLYNFVFGYRKIAPSVRSLSNPNS